MLQAVRKSMLNPYKIFS